MSNSKKVNTNPTFVIDITICVIIIIALIFSYPHITHYVHMFHSTNISVSPKPRNKLPIAQNVSTKPLNSTQSTGLFSLHKPITTKQYTCTKQIPVSEKTSQVSSWVDNYLSQVKNLSSYTPCISRVNDEEEQTGSITFIKKGYNPKGAFNLSGKKITKQYTCTTTEPTSKQSKVVSHWIDNYLSLVSNLRDYNVAINRVADNQDQTGVITFIKK